MDDDDPLTGEVEPRTRRYLEEDLSLTTTKELRGWYFYGIAAEAFAVCGPGSFLPVTLEGLARANGVLWSDRKTPCYDAPKSDSARLLMGRDEGTDNNQCVVSIFGAQITTASFAMYTFSAAVFIQALALVSFSSVADYGNNRKRFLIIFAAVGATAGMLFLFITPGVYLLAPPLGVLTIMSLGCSFVMLNAFLPLLSSNHPTVRAQEKELQAELPPPTYEPSSVTPFTPITKQRPSPALAFSNSVSARGVGLGYAAAVFVQILCIMILFLNSKLHISTSRTLPLRLAIFLAASWWAVFTIPTYMWLRDRPGPPLPAQLVSSATSSDSTIKTNLRKTWTYTRFAWTSLYRTLRMALRLTQLRLFLVAWFLMSDAIATVGSTAIMFARTELHLSPTGIAFLSITATCSGIAGSLCWPIVSRRFNLRSSRTIVGCLCVMEFIPVYGLLGYLPPIQALGVGGLQKSWEIYPLSIVYGIAMGGLSSYCRSFYGQLVPRGKEAAFYALFAITDKGSSAIGPAVVGRIVDSMGTIRPAFWFLLVLIGVPIGLVSLVNEVKGQGEAAAVAEKVDGNVSLEMQERGGVGEDLRTEGHQEEFEALMANGDREDDHDHR